MKSSKSVLAAMLCLGLGACDGAHESASPAASSAAPEEAQPIIGGETDTGDPSVVAVFAQQLGATSGFLCTGSVIAPTVVLTAAHCVSASETGANARFVVLTANNINRPGGQQLAVKEVHANPRWSAKNLQNGHDQGIVILAQPTTLAPLPFNAHALAASSAGAALRIVGYGLDDGVDQTGAGVKRQALTKLGSVESTLIEVGNSQKGTCNGDSGGPAFMKLGGVETIVGTTSYGDETCSDGGYDARVDTDLDFIQPFLDGASCTPACSGRACGSDGCGGTCGTCDGGGACFERGQVRRDGERLRRRRRRAGAQRLGARGERAVRGDGQQGQALVAHGSGLVQLHGPGRRDLRREALGRTHGRDAARVQAVVDGPPVVHRRWHGQRPRGVTSHRRRRHLRGARHGRHAVERDVHAHRADDAWLVTRGPPREGFARRAFLRAATCFGRVSDPPRSVTSALSRATRPAVSTRRFRFVARRSALFLRPS